MNNENNRNDMDKTNNENNRNDMNNMKIAGTDFIAPRIIMGCMRIGGMPDNEVKTLVNTALDEGINFFDHADIYAGGKSEEVFAKAVGMTPRLREQIILQTKCSIREGYYDYSKEHIIQSADDSLRRLKTDYLDILLLHRPDTLMEPEVVADAFSKLHDSGKVRYFGVSNHNPMQIELLNKYMKHKIVINQLQLSLAFSGMIDSGIHANMKEQNGMNFDGSILEYCRLKDITIQAWSPFQYGTFEGVFLGNEKFPLLNKKLDELASAYNVTNMAIASAWILRHPANIQMISGTTNPDRLRDICKAARIRLTRPEWYALYEAAGNKLP